MNDNDIVHDENDSSSTSVFKEDLSRSNNNLLQEVTEDDDRIQYDDDDDDDNDDDDDDILPSMNNDKRIETVNKSQSSNNNHNKYDTSRHDDNEQNDEHQSDDTNNHSDDNNNVNVDDDVSFESVCSSNTSVTAGRYKPHLTNELDVNESFADVPVEVAATVQQDLIIQDTIRLLANSDDHNHQIADDDDADFGDFHDNGIPNEQNNAAELDEHTNITPDKSQHIEEDNNLVVDNTQQHRLLLMMIWMI